MRRGKEITKKILRGLLVAGAIYVAASSPYFVFYFYRNLWRTLGKKRVPTKKKDPCFENAFYYLKRKGYLAIQQKGHQIYIQLTEEGRKRAGRYLIDDLEIKKPKKWNRKWRIVIFDIPNITTMKRNVLREKLKALGFYCLQRSVLVYPYECAKEIELLRDFFGLTQKELIVIVGEIENDTVLRKFFRL